jgi:hypothetical protein
MAEEKQCPLKVASPKPMDKIDTVCKPDCAWYMEKEKEPVCAIKLLAKWAFAH